MMHDPSGYHLPPSSHVAIDRLAGCFNSVTNSYKFYWFLAILEQVRTREDRVIPIDVLLSMMMASVWYPANYFRLNFGKQDKLQSLTELLQRQMELAVDSKIGQVRRVALESLRSGGDLERNLKQLGNYVPYRFLRPFVFDAAHGLPDWKVNDAVAVRAADAFAAGNTKAPYQFVDNLAIELEPTWHQYFVEHNEILAGFTLWHLSKYLQRNNPNVANISGKLFPPQKRDLNLARRFWHSVFSQQGSVICIYSGSPMTAETFTIDHFLPWRFVAHDLLWNLLPTPKEVNSSKSDNLPDAALYFEPFTKLQYDAIHAVASGKKGRLLEDYVLLFGVEDTRQLQGLSYSEFRKNLRDAVVPQMQIAKNMGFRTNWRYART